MIILSQFLDKRDNQKRSEQKKGNMKNGNTYKLLIQSEEKRLNILETVVYGLVALSVIVSIWQFAETPMQTVKARTDRPVEVEIAS
jgi:hypothetical protein